MTTNQANEANEAEQGPALLAEALNEDVRVVRGVDAGQLDEPTPCGDWDVRTLVNHLILWTSYSAERRAHGESAAEDLMTRDFTADPGFAQDYATHAEAAIAAWSDPAAWQRTLSVMGSEMPAADVGAMLIMEMVLHGWDLARATGQEYRCSDALAAAALATVRAQAEMFRQYDGFAAEVTVPAGAGDYDRLLAVSGRDPAWAAKA